MYMEDKIIIASMLTDKIYRTYMNFHVYKRDKKWLLIPIMSGLILVFGLINLYTNSPLLAFIFISLAIYLFSSRILRFYISVNRICHQFALTNEPKLFYTIEIDTNNILVSNDNEEAYYCLNKLYQIYIFNDVIYLYVNKQNAFILPLTELDNTIKNRLIETLNNNVDSNKILNIN